MKYLIPALISAFVFASCAGAPAGAPVGAPIDAPIGAPSVVEDKAVVVAAPPQAAEKRIITVRIPMETKSMVQFADGSLDEYTLSEYDSQGRLILQRRFSASGVPMEQIEYTYVDGLLSSIISKDGEGKQLSLRQYRYNPAGLIVAEHLFDGTGRPVSSFEFGYDGSGNRLFWIVKDGRGIKIAETRYSYNNGRIIGAELFDGSGRRTGSATYGYSPEGSLLSQSIFNAGGSLLRVETNFWENGRLVREERTGPGGQLQQRVRFEYGSDNEILRKTVEDFLGKSKQILEYEYAFREEQRTIQD